MFLAFSCCDNYVSSYLLSDFSDKLQNNALYVTQRKIATVGLANLSIS